MRVGCEVLKVVVGRSGAEEVERGGCCDWVCLVFGLEVLSQSSAAEQRGLGVAAWFVGRCITEVADSMASTAFPVSYLSKWNTKSIM